MLPGGLVSLWSLKSQSLIFGQIVFLGGYFTHVGKTLRSWLTERDRNLDGWVVELSPFASAVRHPDVGYTDDWRLIAGYAGFAGASHSQFPLKASITVYPTVPQKKIGGLPPGKNSAMIVGGSDTSD